MNQRLPSLNAKDVIRGLERAGNLRHRPSCDMRAHVREPVLW
jgi:hypothetical protein